MRPLSFRYRRWISLTVVLLVILLVILLVWGWSRVQFGRLAQVSFFTGGTLLGCLILLALLGVRRRLPILPLGTVSTWTQVHIYTSLFCLAVYVMHVPAIIADGVFECGLSLVFLLVSASGVYGLYVSRSIPKKLTAVEGQHRFDRVSWHRNQIAETARDLLGEVSEQSGMRVLGGFYDSYLKPFFQGRPSLAYVVVPTGVRRRRLLSGLKELDRYLESESRSTAGRLAALVRRRDDLDYQFALQLRLRLWLVIHSVFSVGLLAGSIVHAVLAWRFAG